MNITKIVATLAVILVPTFSTIAQVSEHGSRQWWIWWYRGYGSKDGRGVAIITWQRRLKTSGGHVVRYRLAVVSVLVICAGVAITVVHGHAFQQNAADRQKQPTVLFLCPHGAGKSILASAYFQKVAKERGLNVRVDAAGTEPDAQVSPMVADHLRQKGYKVPVNKPRKVTQTDIDTADVVISMGCDLTGMKVPAGSLRNWNEVPGPSQDLKAADEAIRRRVIALVEELLAEQKK